jgi:KaiC/GvpD/RAD55 family RecA-like ATPase
VKNELEELLKKLTLRFIVEEKFFDSALVLKINPIDWPNCRAKEVAVKYAQTRQTSGHQFAAVQVSGYLNEVETDEFFEDDLKILKAQYEILLKKFRARELANNIMRDPENVEKYMADYQVQKGSDELIHFSSSLEEVFRETVRAAAAGQAVREIPGWNVLSHLIGGFNQGRVGIVMAQTGFGKTTLSVNLALRASEEMNVVYFNMEMTKQDFAEKLIMAAGEIDFKSLKKEPMKFDPKLAEIYRKYEEKKLFFSQGKALSVPEIFAVSRVHHKKHNGLDMIIVDYDQKLVFNLSKETPEWKALQIAVEQFEMLSKELNCYVLILAQENEGGDVSGSKRSKFPASTVMRFFKHEMTDGLDRDVFIIQAVKNRFGKRNAAVRVEYDAEKSRVTEQAEFNEAEIKNIETSFRTGARPATMGPKRTDRKPQPYLD